MKVHFLFVSLLFSLVCAREANSGTYNFYLNNVEQGNDSSAAPSLTASDGKSSDAQTIATIKGSDTSAVPSTPSSALIKTAEMPALEQISQAQLSKSRLSVGVYKVGRYSYDIYGVMFDYAYGFGRFLGISAFTFISNKESLTTWGFGGELEISPITHWTDPESFQFFLLGGVSEQLFYNFAGHFGVRILAPVSPRFEVLASFRMSDRFHNQMDLGAAYRF